MLRSGLDVQGALLALCAASHSVRDFHLVGVRGSSPGLGWGSMRYPRTRRTIPSTGRARDAWIRRGRHGKEIPNCSGKHAGMLRTCVRAGWSTEDYLDPTHPLQVEVAATVAELAGGVIPGDRWLRGATLRHAAPGSPGPCVRPVRGHPTVVTSSSSRMPYRHHRVRVGDWPRGIVAPPGGSRAHGQGRRGGCVALGLADGRHRDQGRWPGIPEGCTRWRPRC